MCEATGIAPGSQQRAPVCHADPTTLTVCHGPTVLSGFPQKPLELGDEDAITGTLKKGDTVHVNANGGGAPAAAAGPSSTGTSLAGCTLPTQSAAVTVARCRRAAPSKTSPKAKPVTNAIAKAAAVGKKRKKKGMGPGRTLADSGEAMFQSEDGIMEKMAMAASSDALAGDAFGRWTPRLTNVNCRGGHWSVVPPRCTETRSGAHATGDAG